MRWAQVSAIVLGNAWKVCFVIFSIRISTTCLVALGILTGSWAKQVFCLSTLEMLGLSCRLLMFLICKSTLSIVMVFSLKSSTAPKSCKVCLPIITSYNGSMPTRGYLTISGHRCTLLLAEYSTHKGELNITHLFGLKGAVGSAP
jgi:hypothetical protein